MNKILDGNGNVLLDMEDKWENIQKITLTEKTGAIDVTGIALKSCRVSVDIPADSTTSQGTISVYTFDDKNTATMMLYGYNQLTSGKKHIGGTAFPVGDRMFLIGATGSGTSSIAEWGGIGVASHCLNYYPKKDIVKVSVRGSGSTGFPVGTVIVVGGVRA